MNWCAFSDSLKCVTQKEKNDTILHTIWMNKNELLLIKSVRYKNKKNDMTWHISMLDTLFEWWNWCSLFQGIQLPGTHSCVTWCSKFVSFETYI